MNDISNHVEELRSALVAGRQRDAREAALTLAAHASQNFPALHAALNLLDYYNQLTLINEVMARAWEQVQNDEGYSRSAVAAYAGRATDHLIYDYLESVSKPDGHDPRLQHALAQYFPVDPERLDDYLLLLAGTAGRRWQAEDFAELDVAALGGLLVEFMGYARRAGVPYGRVHLAREQLPRYLADRQAGYLYPREDVTALLRQGRRPPPSVLETPRHPLIPDRLTLSEYLRKLVQTINPRRYSAAALLELVPLWIDFLAARQLITPADREEAMAELEGLEAMFVPVWKQDDPGIGRPLQDDPG